MKALLFCLLASTIFASIPGCFFGDQSLLYTEDLYTFDNYDQACSSSYAMTVELAPENTNEESLIKWLHLRRGLRECKITKAFAYYANSTKSVQDPRGCCIITPRGVDCYSSCPEELPLPALCYGSS